MEALQNLVNELNGDGYEAEIRRSERGRQEAYLWWEGTKFSFDLVEEPEVTEEEIEQWMRDNPDEDEENW